MQPKVNILFIEDEQNILTFVTKLLYGHNYKVTTAITGTEGLQLINSICPDLILLDLGLPDMDGQTIIRQVREWSDCPIIVISARTNEHEKVKALDLGADDYITKPFNILEVKARMKAILRRNNSNRDKETVKSNVLVVGDMKIDCDSRSLFIKGKEIYLTAKEFDLLELLAFNPNRVYSRDALLKTVWGADYPGDGRTVDVHIRRLREKIEDNSSEPKYVHTKWGVGYYFNV